MKKIYVADFGAGNTCLYCANVNSTVREAEPLNTPGGEPSGYAKTVKGNTLLGMALSGLSYKDLMQIDEFHINIKARPSATNRAQLVEYFRSWLNKMKEQHPEQFKNVDEPYWFIGCPTGDEWKEKDVLNLYRSIFEEAGYENVYIIPESSAALAFYQQVKHILDEHKDGTQMLLFDQGAYSLDVTNYSNGKITSFGGYLGASIVERMIVHMILYREEEEIRMGKGRMINFPQTVKAAREHYEQEGSFGEFYTYLLLQTRVLKEQYFTAVNNNTLLQGADMTRPLDFEVDGDSLTLFVNSKIMDSVLNNIPIRELLGEKEFETLAPEVREEIGNQTWMGTFNTFLKNLDNEYPSIGKGENTIIMLTGGGSLMPCVSEAIKNRYSSARVHCDKEAISAIGKGMAYWGPDKITSIEFEKAFMEFLNKEIMDDDGDCVNSLYYKLNKSFFECIKEISNDLMMEENAALIEAFTKWRDYSCNSDEMPVLIENRLNNWSSNTAIPKFSKIIEDAVGALKNEINEEFGKVLTTFGLDRIDILETSDEVFLSNTKGIVPTWFSKIIEMLVSFYNENEIWSIFPNPKKRLFSDERNDIYNKSVDSLNQWLKKRSESTIRLCIMLFFEEKYNARNTFGINMNYEDCEECTFSHAFCLEGYIDLCDLMRKNVKNILGKLVIEEYLTDD